jgi:hypothetical protein
MAERKDEERVRNLLDEIDGRLRDAERLRSHADDRQKRPAVYPDRRRSIRVPEVSKRDRDDPE